MTVEICIQFPLKCTPTKCSTAGLPCYTAVARRLKRALHSPLKLELLASKFPLLNPKSEENLSLFRCCGYFMKEKEKLSVMEKICLRLRVFYVRFANVRKSFLCEQNFLFGRNKPAEGRLSDYFSRKITSCTNFYVILLITELSSLLWNTFSSEFRVIYCDVWTFLVWNKKH